MNKYDDLFEETAPDDSVFADKGVLDPLADPDVVVGREEQEYALATLLNSVTEGYLPITVSIYGPPGTGKTLTTRRICAAFAARTEAMAVEYVNLKECRTLFSVANEIHRELTGEKKQAYEGLDGIFEGIWAALKGYPQWTVLILDEIDHVKHDSNYDSNDFFYRLLRGEGKLERDIRLSVWLCSNELLNVDLRFDSRVRSAMDGEEVFFPPYDPPTLKRVMTPRLERAFHEEALPAAVAEYGAETAANQWGDVRKTLTLFRQAGETAIKHGDGTVTGNDIDANVDTAEQAATTQKLLALPFQHMLTLNLVTMKVDPRTDGRHQPVSTGEIRHRYEDLPEKIRVSSRAIREIVTELETMGLLETWIDARGRGGRVKQVRTTFDPQWVNDALDAYADHHRGHLPNIDPAADG